MSKLQNILSTNDVCYGLLTIFSKNAPKRTNFCKMGRNSVSKEIKLTSNTVIAKGDAPEVGRTISDSSQYLACIMFINLFSASIKL